MGAGLSIFWSLAIFIIQRFYCGSLKHSLHRSILQAHFTASFRIPSCNGLSKRHKIPCYSSINCISSCIYFFFLVLIREVPTHSWSARHGHGWPCFVIGRFLHKCMKKRRGVIVVVGLSSGLLLEKGRLEQCSMHILMLHCGRNTCKRIKIVWLTMNIHEWHRCFYQSVLSHFLTRQP